jgi:pimeloyl-ACP methyl ester carboxylesterase
MKIVAPPSSLTPDPTRAAYPDDSGFVERDGVRIFYEVYGDGEPTVMLLPSWSIVHSRAWKAQIPYLARHYRVVTLDGRGNGRSDRPRGAEAYGWREFMQDSVAVMDATDTRETVVVGASRLACVALGLAVAHPDRVLGAVFAYPFAPLTRWPPIDRLDRTFDERRRLRRVLWTVANAAASLPALRTRSGRLFARRVSPFEGAAKFNAEYWRRDYRGFLEWFFPTIQCTDPHSTRMHEDLIGFALETDPETLADTWRGELPGRDEFRRLCAAVSCPVLVIHGTEDIAYPFPYGEALALETGGKFVALEGTGHPVSGRKPVAFNLALREFIDALGTAARGRLLEAGRQK